MRSFIVALLFASLFSTTVAPALADPAGDLQQAMSAFAAVKSVHIDMKTENGGTGTEDMVAPNKMRATMTMMGRQMQMVRIGDDTWVNFMGQWRKTHYSNPIITQMNAAQAILSKHKDVREGYNVTDGGPAMVNGTPAHKYHMVDKQNGASIDVYVGPGHLPLQIVWSHASGENMTWTYSQYNSVADITPPM
jgi:outer membrane lipoprotein-sorting protein